MYIKDFCFDKVARDNIKMTVIIEFPTALNVIQKIITAHKINIL